MGCPETLITDQGREFVNELSSALYTFTNTEHRITSAYHPQKSQKETYDRKHEVQVLSEGTEILHQVCQQLGVL